MTLRNAVNTLCIIATSLTAGSIFCFPLFGPSLTRDLHLSLTQTNVIWAGAVLGEYLSAAPWGMLGDAYGPRVLSMSAGVIFLVAYQLMAHADGLAITSNREALSHGQDPRVLGKANFVVTVASFVAVGSGVAASYFSAVTASTRLFKSKPGLAIAGPLTLFSLSSLFLTSLGTWLYTDRQTGELNASAFLSMLGVLCGSANILSAILLRVPPADNARGGRANEEGEDERSPLLANSGEEESTPSAHPACPGVPQSQSAIAFLMTPSVWALALLMVVGVGAAEMVLGSVGNMVVALLGTSTTRVGGSFAAAGIAPPSIGPVALTIRAQQVKLLAAANAIARLSGGFLSDLVAPRRGPSSPPSRPRIQISRLTLLILASLMALGAYVWAAFGLTTTDGLPLFSIVVGVSYGLMFTLVPAITVSAFGNAHFGRNWGLLSYCCAIGSAAYSLLYATVSDAVADRKGGYTGGGQGGTCLAGPECFRASFIISSLGLAAALVALAPVWRRWRSFV